MPLPSDNKDNPTLGAGFYSSADGVSKAGRSWLGANQYWDWFLGVGTRPNVSFDVTTEFEINGVKYPQGT